jgi:hypothetical protein
VRRCHGPEAGSVSGPEGLGGGAALLELTDAQLVAELLEAAGPTDPAAPARGCVGAAAQTDSELLAEWFGGGGQA